LISKLGTSGYTMESLLSWIKLPKTVAWPIVLVCGLLLWGPEKFNKGLGLDLFVNEYRIGVGVAFLFFLATGLMPVVPWLFNFIKKTYESFLLKKHIRQKLRELTPEEKSILRQYVDGDTKAQDLNIQNGVVGRLIKVGILELGFTVSYGGRMGSYTFPVNIRDWAWNQLKEHPELLR
jgi:hypothetical protein